MKGKTPDWDVSEQRTRLERATAEWTYLALTNTLPAQIIVTNEQNLQTISKNNNFKSQTVTCDGPNKISGRGACVVL